MLAKRIPGWPFFALFQTPAVSGLVFRLIQEITGPGGNRLANDLGALAIQEGEHIEVAIALGSLRPELAGDLADGLHAQVIDLDRVQSLEAPAQAIDEMVAPQLAQEFPEEFDCIGQTRSPGPHDFRQLP